jgi:hypothetical protein
MKQKAAVTVTTSIQIDEPNGCSLITLQANGHEGDAEIKIDACSLNGTITIRLIPRDGKNESAFWFDIEPEFLIRAIRATVELTKVDDE